MGSYCGRNAKIRRNHDASGRLILQNFTRFAACGIGFHRIPTYRNGHQIHPDWMVGTNLRAVARLHPAPQAVLREGVELRPGRHPGPGRQRLT